MPRVPVFGGREWGYSRLHGICLLCEAVFLSLGRSFPGYGQLRRSTNFRVRGMPPRCCDAPAPRPGWRGRGAIASVRGAALHGRHPASCSTRPGCESGVADDGRRGSNLSPVHLRVASGVRGHRGGASLSPPSGTRLSIHRAGARVVVGIAPTAVTRAGPAAAPGERRLALVVALLVAFDSGPTLHRARLPVSIRCSHRPALR